MQQLTQAGSVKQHNKLKEITIVNHKFNWLIIDAALCPEVVWFAQGTGSKVISLFEQQDDALRDNGAWLINIDGYVDIIRLALNKDKTGCAALWLKSEQDTIALSLQLSYRIYAELPDGKTTRFRWYDPRVLDSWLSHLDSERLKEFLQPVVELAYTSPNPFYAENNLCCWQRQADGSYGHNMINLKE